MPEITSLVIISLVSSVPMIIASFIGLNQYIKARFTHNLYFFLAWFFMAAFQIGLVFAELFLSVTIKLLSNYCMIPAGFAVILLIDSVSIEHIDPIKLSIIWVLSMIVIFTSLDPEAEMVKDCGGELSVVSGGFFKVFAAIFILLIGMLVLIYWARIFFAAPKSLKKISLINLIGGILIGFITPLAYLLNFSVLLPGSTNLSLAVGALICTVVFAREPKLAYILPFKALRITVIQTQSGIPLYTHTWSAISTIDEALFSGMVQGITSILDEAVKKGGLREIFLEQAILIMHRSKDHPVACVLVATKPNPALRAALIAFADAFFRDYATHFDNPTDIAVFDSAENLIQQFFPFVPVYE